MAYILHIDTGWSETHIGLSHQGSMIAWHKLDNQKQQASLLAPLVHAVMQKSNIQLKDLSAIAILNGPGSYTGLRIGMSHAKGYAYGLDIPIVINSYLEALMWSGKNLPNFDNTKKHLYLLKARKGEYFGMLCDNNSISSKLKHLTIDNCKELMSFDMDNHQIVTLKDQFDDDDNNNFNEYFVLIVENFMYDKWASIAYKNYQEGCYQSFLTAECNYLKGVYLTNKTS